MPEHSEIIVDAVRIRRVTAESTFALGILCVPSPGSDRPSTADMNSAVAGLRLPDYPDQRFHAVEVSQGVAIYVFPVDSPKHAVQLAESIAEAVRPLGFTGAVTACVDKVGPRPRTGRFAYSAAICSVDAARDNDRVPTAFQAVKKNWDTWAVQNPVFKGIVEFVSGWAKTNATGPILAGLHFTMSRCEPHQVAEVIMRCCEDIGWAEMLFPTASGDWYVHFTIEGWIVAGTEISAGKGDALESLTHLLEGMAPLYDYAAVAKVHFGLLTPVSVISQRGFPSPRQGELSADHAVMKAAAPGIYGIQVLGPGHPDLKPAAYWDVVPLGSGRRMFIAPAAERWWSRMENFPQEGFDTLRDANRELLGRWA